MNRLARWSLAHPAAAVVWLLLCTALLAAGLPRLQSDVGYRAFLGAEHPSVRVFDEFLERFGGGLPMLAIYRCEDTAPCDSVFEPAALQMAEALVRGLAHHPAVRRIESPATAVLIAPGPLGPLPRRFIEEGRVATDRERLARYARTDPSWKGQLVSDDGRTGAIVIELQASDSDSARAAYRALDEALAPARADGFRFALAGGPVEFVVAGGELEDATAQMIPVMVALVGAVLWLLFRSLAAAAVGLVTVGIAVLWTMGLLGWLGWAQNSLTQTLPPLVLVIGVCDAVHLISMVATARATAETPNETRRARIERVCGDIAGPCTMTTLTTAAGFLSFVSAPLESFQRFGTIAAFGVAAALVLSFSLLPLLLLAVPGERIDAPGVSARWNLMLAGVLRLSERHAFGVLAAGAALSVAAGVGLTQLRVEASFEELYGERSRVVQWVDFLATHLRRPDTLEIEIALPDDARLAEPETLAVIEALSQQLESLEILGEARSVLTPLSQTYGLLDSEAGGARYAADVEENEGLLAVVQAFGAGVGEDGLARWVDTDRRRVRISIDADKPPQGPMRRDLARVDAWLAALPDGFSGYATGPLAVVADMVDAIQTTQLRSFAGAFAAVLVLVSLYLRSLRWALLALVPTVLPVLVTLGTMGALDLPLDVGSAMVAAVVVGIAIDDTIHLLDHFRKRQGAGASAAIALQEAVRHVGRALVTTSLALAIGFSALSLSPWKSVASFGLVAAVAIVAALLAALLVLPSLVVAAERVAQRAR